MLQACLSSIAQIHIPENIIFSAIVIDNDEQPNAKYIVDGFREVLPFDIIYYHEPNPGIPQARNAALKIALEENTDFLGFIDDDEKVAQNWLVEIMKVFNAYQCDIVQGRVHFEYKEAIPLLNFKKKQKTRKTGDRLRTASTDNVVMKKKIFAPNPDGLNLRFNEDMRYTGGSDTEFFFRATDSGASIVWSNKALVSEFIPKSRATFLWQLKRAYRTEANASMIYRERKGFFMALVKYIPKVILRFISFIIITLLTLPMMIFSRKRGIKLLLLGAKNIVSSVGATLGLLKIQPRPYSIIDPEN